MPKVDAEEPINWDLGSAVRETDGNFSTDLQLLMTETTNDHNLLKTLVCPERQQIQDVPKTEEYMMYKKNLST